MDAAWELSVHDLKAMSPQPLLVDCRNKWEWDLCRLDGAILCPLQEFEQHVQLIRERAGTGHIVIYCHTGRRSLVAARILRQQGITALSLHGGIDAWADIDPTTARY